MKKGLKFFALVTGLGAAGFIAWALVHLGIRDSRFQRREIQL